MRFLRETEETLSAFEETCMDHRFFEFNPKQDDYFLNFYAGWDEITTEVYTFQIGRYTFDIPSGMFLCIGCPSGSVDWMSSDEIVGREMGAMTLSPSFKSWSIEDIKVKGVMERNFFFPMTKNPLPVTDRTGQRVVIIASTDQYHVFKDKDYGVFFI